MAGLLLVGLGLPITTAQETYDDDACLTGLKNAKEQLATLKETGSLTTPQAAAVVDEHAGPPCGFSILQGTFPEDTEQLKRHVAAVSVEAEYVEPPVGVVTPSDGHTRFVPCAQSGSGLGTLTSYVLGIEVDDAPAAGEWSGTDRAVGVTGSAALFSGSQAGAGGIMFVGPVGPLPSLSGSSGATCMETTTVTVISAKCWYFIVYVHCTAKTETTVSLTLCGADAEQDMLALGLITYSHSYVVDGDPCGIANLAPIDLTPITDTDLPIQQSTTTRSVETVVMAYDPVAFQGVPVDFVEAP